MAENSELLVGVATLAGTWLLPRALAKYDGPTVHRWLLANTTDESGNSHIGTIAIAKGMRLSEERVHRACMDHGQIYGPWSGRDSEKAWSVWRAEPQRPAPQLFILEAKPRSAQVPINGERY